MNIATKLIAGLVAGLVLTACSGGGSSDSSPKPNSESTPKVDMSAPKAEQPKKEEAPQADSQKEKEPKSMAPLMGSPKVEKQKDNNLQEKSPKADEPQVIDPKLGAPQKDDQKLEEPKNKSNAEILKELGVKDIKTGIITRPDVILNLTLDEQENIQIRLSESDIVRNDLKITNTIPNQDIRTLKDSTGRLLGYYGYMQLNQVREGERYGINNVDLVGHYLLSMDESTKTIPDKSMKYIGNMLYSYNVDSQNLVADVQASYSHTDKKLSMDIFGKDGEHWRLADTSRTNVKLPLNQLHNTAVSENGDISGRLYLEDSSSSKFVPDANFSGSLFGKNGEVLAGNAISDKWQGVIGATATKEDKK
ncbi:transferrin-binding protein-like solute binding protein [Actinobacillus genomosp. 1]|uniref:transferrin-binding protein-like solute binding protein n=1 Tax=Actinobacillus genomosp. 1 TaxID=254839 RepID=UPI0024436D48|nr:transferrin-binding protein-like solute binding protein [Actinobacillus genomosp. 1]WGE91057.1 transferrin-binding protein-like solute binding protein [Actinobacillus genomosp. 1]